MEKETMIFGIRAVIEAIKANENIDKIFIQTGLKGQLYQELDKEIKKGKFSVSYVPQEKLNKLSKDNHQGVVAKIAPITFWDIDKLVDECLTKKDNPLFLILDQVNDVRNFGAIVRTAECTGVDGIIIQKKGGAPVNGESIKTSAGAMFKMPICKVDHVKDAIYHLQGSDVKIIGATEKAENTLYDVSFKGATAIIMGSEGKGITPSVLKICDEKAKLPILGEIESLNVSVACGAILYEALRQRL
jgi:23S rRNA (guanosine2251-2'-O)-methyltransferase